MLCALGNSHFDALQPLIWLVRSGTQAFSWYANPQVDRLIDQAAATVEPESTPACYKKPRNWCTMIHPSCSCLPCRTSTGSIAGSGGSRTRMSSYTCTTPLFARLDRRRRGP